jgi:SAM-dependent methyltransferase
LTTYGRKFRYRNKAIAESYFYKRFSHPKGKREHEATVAALARAVEGIGGVKKILDVACGTGRFSDVFGRNGYRYFGADISLEMMGVLPRSQSSRGMIPPLIQCDAETLPFKDNAFDCVLCVRFMNEHIPAAVRESVLKEMKRVSRGWLVVQSHRIKPMDPFIFLKSFLRKLRGADVSKYKINSEILNAGWENRGWVRINRRLYVGVYQDTSKSGNRSARESGS